MFIKTAPANDGPGNRQAYSLTAGLIAFQLRFMSTTSQLFSTAPSSIGARRMLRQDRDDLLAGESGLLHLSSLVASKTTNGAKESSINWREWRGRSEPIPLMAPNHVGLSSIVSA